MQRAPVYVCVCARAYRVGEIRTPRPSSSHRADLGSLRTRIRSESGPEDLWTRSLERPIHSSVKQSGPRAPLNGGSRRQAGQDGCSAVRRLSAEGSTRLELFRSQLRLKRAQVGSAVKLTRAAGQRAGADLQNKTPPPHTAFGGRRCFYFEGGDAIFRSGSQRQLDDARSAPLRGQLRGSRRDVEPPARNARGQKGVNQPRRTTGALPRSSPSAVVLLEDGSRMNERPMRRPGRASVGFPTLPVCFPGPVCA